MKAIDRLYVYFELKSIKPTAFEKIVGLSNGYLGTQRKRNADMGEAVFVKIINYCRDLSLVWLITGEGDMLQGSSGSNIAHIAGGTNKFKQEINSANNGSNVDYNLLQKIIEQQQEQISRYQEQVSQLLEKLL
ncbi:MAG: hypothetical protein SNG38_08310 [Rikenellaceae bacterium]